MKKRRPEIMKPGLKELTPHERKVIASFQKWNKERWAKIMERNKWRPAK
jgi:hypothetical protein